MGDIETSFEKSNPSEMFSSNIGRYELTLEKKWDKEIIFEFEAFLDEIIEVIDAIPRLFESRFRTIREIKTKSFKDFKKSLMKKFPEDELTVKVNRAWEDWVKVVKDFRDDETHHSLYYNRYKIRITSGFFDVGPKYMRLSNGFIEFIPPSIPRHSIKSVQHSAIEDYLSEFESRCSTDERDDDRTPGEAFWEAFDEYFNTIEDFSKMMFKKTWKIFSEILT